MEDIATILLVAVGVCMLIGALSGFRNGAARQVIKCITIALAAVVAYFVTLAVYPEVEAMFAGQSLQEALGTIGLDIDLNSIETFGPILAALDAALISKIISIPIALIGLPLIFVILFITFVAVLGFIHWIACGLLGFTKRNNNTATRVCGLVVGAIQGFAIVLIVTVPLIGIVNLTGSAVEVMQEEDPDGELTVQVTELYNSYITPVIESPIYQMIADFGGAGIYNNFAMITVDGDTYDMNEEFRSLVKIGVKVPGFASTDWTNLSNEDKANMLALIETIDESDLSAEIVAGMFRGLSVGIKDMGILTLPEPYATFVFDMIDVFSDSTSLNVANDLTTFVNVCFIVSDSGVLSGGDMAGNIDLLIQKDENGKTLIDKIITELNSNDRTKHIVTGLTKLSLSLIQEQLGNSLGEDVNVEEMYNGIKEGFNGILEIDTTTTPPTIVNEETGEEELNPEYVKEVETVLDTTLKDHDIELEEDVKQQMAEIVAENHEKYEEMTELSDEEFNDMLLKYYDAYLKAQENGGEFIPPQIPAE